jgi:fructosamine-3-kinase
MVIWPHLEEVISDRTARLFHIKQRQALSGGDINNAYKISDGKQAYFVKTNRKSQAYMFEAEMIGLKALKQSNTILVPEVITHGVFGSDSYLVLSFVDMQGTPDSALLGKKLAQLHSNCETRFGFDVDNTIGLTPQINAWSNDWVEFWLKERLGYQIHLAQKNGLGHKLYDLGLKLVEKTPYFFQSYQPKASLLHGDLWSGNCSATHHGEPVIYDPPCYYGDHETDLAMTELFGHPGIHFYDAYDEIFAIDDGYKTRKLFYNVYHILNHANLFGGGYVQQSINSIEQLLVA